VTITLGTYRGPLSHRRKNFLAATAFRPDWTRMSSTLPCWSTARHRYRCASLIWTNTASVPFVARPQTTTAQLVRVLLPEPVAPGPDRLPGHVDTTFGHQLLHVAEAQWEPVVQPDAMADDLGRKPEPLDTTSLQRSRSSTLSPLTFPAHQPDSASTSPSPTATTRWPRLST